MMHHGNEEATFVPKWGAALFEGRPCFLDHLIPLCHIFDIPLIINDYFLLSLAQSLYPPTKILYRKSPTAALDKLELIFYAQPYRLFPRGIDFPDLLYPREVRSCCTLHGNSEKYLNDFWLERLVDEDVVLLYGPLLVDLLKKKGIYHRLKAPILCGNLRYHFYKKYQPFFDQRMSSFLSPKKNRKRILWAPTWEQENKERFFSLAEQILPQLPSDFQLILKLHPLMVRFFPKEVERLHMKYEGHPSISLLEGMPLVYPLLAETDLFLGDSSSVSYDFLAFNRPLYFLSQESSLLHSLGRVITPDELPSLFHIMSAKENGKGHEARKSWYRYAFAEEATFESVRKELMQCV